MANPLTQNAQAAAGAQADDTAQETFTRDDVINIVNSAISGRDKRLAAIIEKSVADVVGRTLATREQPAQGETQAQAQPGAPVAGQPAGTPELKKLQDQFSALQKRYEEETAARRAVEQRSAREQTRGTVRQQLEAKGIKGTRANAVIALLETSGSLKYGEDGTPSLAIKRARTKGAQADEQEFHDLNLGVADWLATDDAKEFLPPPAPNTPARNPAARPAPAAGANGAARRSLSIDDAIAATEEQLAARQQ